MATYTTSKITKMSLPTLQLKRSDAEKKISELTNELISESVVKNELIKIEKSKIEISNINKEISTLKKRREIADGWIGVIFKTQVIPKNVINSIEKLESKVKNIEGIIHKSESIIWNQENTKKRLENGVVWLDKVTQRIKTIENKDEKLQSLKNKAAESNKIKRVIAKGIKRSLADNEECPYCGFILMGAIHADHIYPVSKGGESTKKNMVLVCADCNSKKSALTLQAFIKKYNLNRDEIETRLSNLGKDF